MAVIFEVCALYTAVLLVQIEDVCAWCLHSAHVGYTRTHKHTQTHTCTHARAVTGSVVVLSLKWIFCCYRKRGGKKEKTSHHFTADRVRVSATVVSVSG